MSESCANCSRGIRCGKDMVFCSDDGLEHYSFDMCEYWSDFMQRDYQTMEIDTPVCGVCGKKLDRRDAALEMCHKCGQTFMSEVVFGDVAKFGDGANARKAVKKEEF